MKKYLLCYILALFLLGIFLIGLNAQEAFDQAADDVRIYYAHAINGTAIGEAPSFPMDIYINGILKMKNVKFGKVTGPKKIPPGNTSIDVYRAGEGPNTGHTPLGEFSYVFKPYENVTVSAYLDNKGESFVHKFSNDLSPAGDPSKCRVVVHNISVGAVDVHFFNKKSPDEFPYQIVAQLEPGDKCVFEIAKKKLTEPNKGKPMAWKLRLREQGEVFNPFYTKNFTIKPGKASLVYLIGSTALGTFKVAKKTAPLE
jgi:hypothetical protein